MAKKREPSKHSRAARRATSPGIDTDKSLKDIKPPKRTAASTSRPSVLAVHHSAGVSKKGSKRKAQLSSKARKRQQRGMEMAEAIVERTSKKLERSFGKSRVIQQRSKDWKDVNRAAVEKEREEQQLAAVVAAATGSLAEASKDEGWETEDDGDGDEMGVDGEVAEAGAAIAKTTLDDDDDDDDDDDYDGIL